MKLHSTLLASTFGLALGLAGFTGGAAALPTQDTFTAAGLGNVGDWTYVSPAIFGSGGGNGFFSTGGSASYELRLATYQHQFGTALTDHSLFGLTPIFDTTVDGVGAIETFSAPSNPFLFYFATLPCAGFFCGDTSAVFSDDYELSLTGQIDMAVYQQGNTFAFFMDDAGPAFDDDNDYNDMVVTVSATDVPEPATLALLGAGLLGLGAVRRRKVA